MQLQENNYQSDLIWANYAAAKPLNPFSTKHQMF